MPNGSTHAKATILLALASGGAAYYFGQPTAQVLALTGGALAGLVLTPDLDVDNGCVSNEVVRRSVGRKGEKFWSLYWRPYGVMIPHRSRLSHMPVLGTAIRLLYLSILPAMIYWFATGAGFSAGTRFTYPVFPAWGWWAIAGLVLADTLHYIMDYWS